jgi:hypothetical protein
LQKYKSKVWELCSEQGGLEEIPKQLSELLKTSFSVANLALASQDKTEMFHHSWGLVAASGLLKISNIGKRDVHKGSEVCPHAFFASTMKATLLEACAC